MEVKNNRDTRMQFSFTNSNSKFLSFNSSSAPEEKSRNAVHDSMSSSGFTSRSGGESAQKPFFSAPLKHQSSDKQSGNYYSIPTYDAYAAPPRPREMTVFPNQPSQNITISMSTPVIRSPFVSTGSAAAAAGGSIKPQPFGGISGTSSPASIVPAASTVVGTTDLRNGSKSVVAPAQLTIFYAGSVCVYDDVSPEKAQAIMLLAGNGSSASHNKIISTPQVQTPPPRPSVTDSYAVNRTLAQTSPLRHSTTDSYAGNRTLAQTPPPRPSATDSYAVKRTLAQTPPLRPSATDSYAVNKTLPIASNSTLLSPIPVTATDTSERSTVKSLSFSSYGIQIDLSKVARPVPIELPKVARPAPPANITSSVAIPQARKASLARFLEKRKERVISSSPYTIGKNFLDYKAGSDSTSNSPYNIGKNFSDYKSASDSISLSIKSSSSFSLPAVK